MIPRPFQSAAMSDVGKRFRAGARAVLLISPTGSGKTVMGAMMAERFVLSGKRVAWGAHRGELLDQAAATLRSFGLDVGMNGRNASAPIQLGTFQSWVSRGACPEADVFIPDEAHHMGDRVGWQGIPAAYKAKGARIVGLTATPARGDGRALPDFDALVVAAQIHELQAMGLLVPLRWRGPAVGLGSQKIAQKPVDAYLADARGRCAIVFAPNVRSADEYAADFCALGVRAKVVRGDMSPDDRADALERHRTGDLPVLVSVNVLTEGFDNPRCDCVLVARGCGNAGLWLQMVGRGLRPCPGKEDCLLLDLRGIAHTLGRPDAPATFSLEGDGITLSTPAAPQGERLCKVCRAPLGGEMVCVECGKDHSPPVPKSAGVELTDWQERWDAAKAALTPPPIVLALAGILRKEAESSGRGKPWKQGAVALRFSFIFKRRPYPQEMAAARNMLRAAETYGAVREVGT